MWDKQSQSRTLPTVTRLDSNRDYPTQLYKTKEHPKFECLGETLKNFINKKK
jgi:hypothetical protein